MPTTAGPKAAAGQDTSVEHNLGLVHACAHRFKGRGIEYDDLYQAGCMGLVKASAAFDADRGVMFSTYAVPVILGEIRRLFRDGGTVKVSRSLKELGLAAGRTRELLGSELGREATVGEVAQRMGRSPEDIAQALAATAPPLSLTEGEEEGSGQIDLPEESPEERLSDLLSLQQLLAALEERDRKLIFLRYYRGKTQTEVARCLGMTQVQVSRREKRILQAMRARMVGCPDPQGVAAPGRNRRPPAAAAAPKGRLALRAALPPAPTPAGKRKGPRPIQDRPGAFCSRRLPALFYTGTALTPDRP